MRKHSLPPELACLPDADLALVESWLDRFAYRQVQELFRQRFGRDISVDKLYRHYQRRQKARLYSIPAAPPLAAGDLAAIRNGEPLPEKLALKALQRRALQLVQQPENSPGDLKELLDIFTYAERADLARQKTALAGRAVEQRALHQQLRAQRLVLDRLARGGPQN